MMDVNELADELCRRYAGGKPWVMAPEDRIHWTRLAEYVHELIDTESHERRERAKDAETECGRLKGKVERLEAEAAKILDTVEDCLGLQVPGTPLHEAVEALARSWHYRGRELLRPGSTAQECTDQPDLAELQGRLDSCRAELEAERSTARRNGYAACGLARHVRDLLGAIRVDENWGMIEKMANEWAGGPAELDAGPADR